MAQHSLKWPAHHRDSRALQDRQLGIDKASVILGFILGLPLGLGVVGDLLAAIGAPAWTEVAGLVLTVAATTAVGMRAGNWLARHLRQG
jgi:hypothetical protein